MVAADFAYSNDWLVTDSHRFSSLCTRTPAGFIYTPSSFIYQSGRVIFSANSMEKDHGKKGTYKPVMIRGIPSLKRAGKQPDELDPSSLQKELETYERWYPWFHDQTLTAITMHFIF